ncbi:MAG: hypothetical protein QOK38_3238 [Acidobacteriaceae bacterium]|jgi:hypothetical protein|nr:hypothetical protein [Acidobacteriaceae bacterium]
MLHALDVDEHLVQVQLVPGRGRRRRRLVAKRWPNFLHQRRMVAYETTTPRSARSSSTSRRLMLNGGEPVVVVRVGGGFMPASLDRLSPDYQNRLP